MAILVWDNGGADSLWSTNENWVGDNAPTLNDSVQFDATSVAPSTCDIAEVINVDIQSTYSGTVTLLPGQTSTYSGFLTVGAGAGFVAQTITTLNLTGALNLDGLAVIDFQLGSILNSSGDLVFPAVTSSILMNGTVNAGVGGTTYNFSNPDNSARINIFNLMDGSICDSSSICYTDSLNGPVGGFATIIGTGNFIVLTAITNLDNFIVDSVIDGAVVFQCNFNELLSADFGNCVISFTDQGQNTITGDNDLHCWKLNVFQAPQNTTIPIQITGSINATIDDIIEIGDNTAPGTRGGIFTWNSTGALVIDGIVIRDNDSIQNTRWVIGALGGPVSVGAQGIIAESPSDIDFSASSNDLNVRGNFVPLSTVDVGTIRIFFFSDLDFSGAASVSGVPEILALGSVAQIMNLSTLTISQFTSIKTAGLLDCQNAWTANDSIKFNSTGNSTVQLLAGGNYTCDFIEAYADTGVKTTLQSSIAATPYTINVSELGPINRGLGISDCDIVGRFIRVDTITGSDDGGNDVTPPFGIDFANFPFDPIMFQGFGKLKKIGPGLLFPNIYRAPHRWHAAAAPIDFFLVKNAIDEQVFNAIDEEVLT